MRADAQACVQAAVYCQVCDRECRGKHIPCYHCFFQPGVAVAAVFVVHVSDDFLRRLSHHVFFCSHPECLRLFGFVSGAPARPGYPLQKAAVLDCCLFSILCWYGKK